MVLVDGNPPSRLPRNILDHPLYKRTFGSFDFDVFKTARNELITSSSIQGCRYTFTMVDEELSIFETDDSNSAGSMILLDGVDCCTWAPNMPVRLQKMCSHWYDEKTDSIYLRPVFFSQREIKYVIYGACTSPRIMCIPTHLQNVFDLSAKPGSDKKQTRALKKVETVKHPAGNLDCDELLVVSEGGDCDEEPWLVSVASKFEDRNLVHLVKCRSGSLKLNFPRYALEFEADVKDGVFHSKNFLGYWLKESQQLEDGLRDFTKYLLLESLDGKEKLIVPQGKVAVSTTRENVSIQVPDTCDMKRKFFHYDVHNRFKNFTSTSICGRLFLAAIYAGTASSLLDDRVCMTGDEHAMELVRESWTNRPLSAQESDQLKCIRGFSTRRNPALVLLCCELEHSSKQLGFLHGHDDFRGYNYKKSPPKKGTALPFVRPANVVRRRWCRHASTLRRPLRTAAHPAKRPAIAIAAKGAWPGGRVGWC